MSSNQLNPSNKLIWVLVAIIGAVAFGYVALNRGETINAMWVLTAAVCVYLIAYRFYSLYIADQVLQVDGTRMTPAFRHNDGLDYVPTNKVVLFGHHFAAIAGAGPLVGPVLAAAEIPALPDADAAGAVAWHHLSRLAVRAAPAELLLDRRVLRPDQPRVHAEDLWRVVPAGFGLRPCDRRAPSCQLPRWPVVAAVGRSLRAARGIATRPARSCFRGHSVR